MASNRRAAWCALGGVRLGGADATRRSGATVDMCMQLPATIVAVALPHELMARSPHLNAFAKIPALCAARRAKALV